MALRTPGLVTAWSTVHAGIQPRNGTSCRPGEFTIGDVPLIASREMESS